MLKRRTGFFAGKKCVLGKGGARVSQGKREKGEIKRSKTEGGRPLMRRKRDTTWPLRASRRGKKRSTPYKGRQIDRLYGLETSTAKKKKNLPVKRKKGALRG